MQISKQARIQHDRTLLESTARCQAEPFFTESGTPYPSPYLPYSELAASQHSMQLIKSAKCYCCKTSFQTVHPFYHQLCPVCAEYNYTKRHETMDLTGYYALVTGGRIKIGYETSLKLLRAGAHVLVTTRFVHNAYRRFSQEPDFNQWQPRLKLYGIDFRYLDAVQTFIYQMLEQLPQLDILINCAAQTITRPPEYYLPLWQAEQQGILPTPTILHTHHPDETTHLTLLQGNKPLAHYCDEFNEPIDNSTSNSWTHTLTSVTTRELVETQIVNAIVPFMLCSQFYPLLLKGHSERFIINVSAKEGQFNRYCKTRFHPHTNMAKAALNMITRTSAQDYVKDKIYMNSVDPGWISFEDPLITRRQYRANGIVPPLDAIDGAARLLAPIADGLRGQWYYGQLLKNFQPSEW